jgi:hypothetical protein
MAQWLVLVFGYLDLDFGFGFCFCATGGPDAR